MEEEVKESPVTEVALGGRKIYLLGTAHISRKSVEEVEEIVEKVDPGRMCIEIDAARYKSITEGQNWKDLNIGQVIRQRKGFLLLANLVLSSFQRRLGEQFGIQQGAEMKKAVEIAEEKNIPFSFADREVQVTLRRAWGKSNFWNKMKLLASLLGSALTREELSEAELENLKKRSALEDMLAELAKLLPSVKEVLIDERDRYLATKIFETAEERVVAVVGAGHVPGIVRWLKKLETGEVDTDLSALETTPEKKWVGKAIGWFIPVAIVGLLAFGIYRKGWEEGLNMLLIWIAVNGGLSGLGAIIALAHPVTILLCIAAAPFTSMVPVIGVGILSGPMEAVLRKPHVKDFENLHDDIKTFRGFYRNRLTRILLVFFFSTIGSAIGTFVGFPYLSSFLFR